MGATFSIQGICDHAGRINSLWPLFGIANQLLAAVALSLATTILLKMHGPKFMSITCVPLVWLVSRDIHRRLSEDLVAFVPRIGFLAQAAQPGVTGSVAAAVRAQIFNNRLDAVVCGTACC